jgi:tetratricopeptide (TPR) repeat protein
MCESREPQPTAEIAKIQVRLRRAEDARDRERISREQAELGLAYFRNRQYPEGLELFDAAYETASELESLDLQVHCLGRKALAYQEAKRLAEAFLIAGDMIEQAEAHKNWGLKCDALAHQAQIQLDSGEPGLALAKLVEARQLAEAVDDPQRVMNLIGMLGNHSLAVASLAQAEAYFEKALGMAQAQGDLPAEVSFLERLGSLYLWMDKPAQAEPLLHRLLAYLEEEQDSAARSSALYNLAQVYDRTGQVEKMFSTAGEGLEICPKKDDELRLAFLKMLVRASFQLGRLTEGMAFARQAIQAASALKDLPGVVELWINLGEASLVAGELAQALEAYQRARQGVAQLGREQDEAHLHGRIGYVLAEMGRPAEAAAHHQKAIQMARQTNLRELEGDQLSLLALAHLDQGELELAARACQEAERIFAEDGQADKLEKTGRLLQQIRQQAEGTAE